MTDDTRYGATEEGVILSLLGGDPGIGPEAEEAGEEAEALRREYTELAGLLASALDPVEPRPQVRTRLLAAVREDGGSRDGAPGSAGEARRRAWALPLAAGLALALLGTTALLSVRLHDSRQRIARLSEEIRRISSQEQEASLRLARLEAEMEAASEKLAMVTEAGAEACPLRPPGAAAPQPLARGILYIAADHQHWFMKVTGLEPAPEDRTYQLWFITREGPVSAGVFHTGPGAEAEIGSPTMPAGITAVAVTLEPAGGAPAPGGATVLYGAQRMSLL